MGYLRDAMRDAMRYERCFNTRFSITIPDTMSVIFLKKQAF